MQMHRACPVCGLVFEREPGYWLGSLYFNYAVALMAVVPTIAVMALAALSTTWIVLGTLIELVVLSPVIIRYARLIWMYVDQMIDPR